ncbi:MAG: chorismate lyase [Gammaproteobacteria bacterium]|nr:chorismate lyase [Gammaproteobacteria bacterium]MCW8958583.1 chorismate lyase [Gammaproteobacteria bacterium]MCW8972341.1 chorismate lyase [Gammaproteobacteria bacterium]MCW8993115.1 chorismate lyase [Gammaproteobacteria bacterium]
MKDNYGKHVLEPVWQSCRQLRRTSLPEQWRSWLLDPDSLTRRLQRSCNGHFAVEVIAQRLERPMLSESRALDRPPNEIALVRQVHLLCDGTPWVFARTVIPLTSLRGGLHRLALLGNKPLGAVLFADPKMRRLPVEVARIHPRHRLYRLHRDAKDTEQPVWGRRSVFLLQDNPLLVSEFFLPGLPARPMEQNDP